MVLFIPSFLARASDMRNRYSALSLPSQMAFRWLPNIAEFFFSLARLIEDSERQLNSASYDSIEFLVRRLDEYERTLATLTSRFYETYGCVPAQQNTVADL